MFVIVLVFGMTVVGCNNGSTSRSTSSSTNNNNDSTNDNNGADTKKAISEKWEISDNNSPYSSFEFTTDNVYIVTENINHVSNKIHNSRSVLAKNSDENLTIRFSEVRAATPTGSNLSPIHTGKYRIDGDNIILEGFGMLNIISLTAEEFIFSFKLENSGNAYEYHAEKAVNTVNESSRTDMLCRFWKFVKVSNPDYKHQIGYGVLFSKAGTYLVTYKDGSAGLSEWKWANKEETIIQYSWNNWQYYGTAQISELTATKLKLIDHFDPVDNNPGYDEVTFELILWK